MGKFITSTRSNGEYQFNLLAENGLVILTSEGYHNEADRDSAIDSVRMNATDSTKFEKLVATDGRFYFNLMATNGQVIGVSQMYETEENRAIGMESVQTNAPGATIQAG